MGIPPRRLLGWEPTSRSWKVKGVRHTVPEPEWDWIDRAIVREWLRLTDRTCPQCGRPLAVHKLEADEARAAGAPEPDETASVAYAAAYLTCPATLALDRAQADAEKRDKARHERGLHPERARHWFTYRADERLPDFTDDD